MWISVLPYRRSFRRLGFTWLLLFLVAQLIAPLHGSLEAASTPLHHDGFTWDAAGDMHDCCDSESPETNAGDCNDNCNDNGDRHDNGDCNDNRDCSDNGDCHDNGDNCGHCCHHQPIQSALHQTDAGCDVLSFRTFIPAILDILPGTLPETFLPPRSLS